MLNRKGSIFEVRVSLAIVRIFIVCTIAFYTFSQLATQTLFERGGTLDDILAAHGKVHVVLPNIAVTPKEPIVLKHLEDDLTPEERAYWEASIERDLREIAEGKPQEYYPIEDLRKRMLDSLSKLYA